MLDMLSHTQEVKTPPQVSNTKKVLEKSRMTAWLSERVSRSQSGVVSETVTLTPVLAELLLATNADNRKVSETFVENYRRDMVAGRWQFNGEPIVVAKDGVLNDGQHRCLAVIAANVSIPMVIVFGVSRESRFTVDQGRIRTAGDYLGMNSHADANALAAVCSFILQWKEYNRISNESRDRPTKSEILDVANHYKDVAESIRTVDRKGASIVGGKSVLGFCHWAISRKVYTGDVTAFMHQLIDGNDLAARNPILVLRNRFLAKERLKINEKIELIFRAWNAHRRKEKISYVKALNGQLPKILVR